MKLVKLNSDKLKTKKQKKKINKTIVCDFKKDNRLMIFKYEANAWSLLINSHAT